MKLKKNIKIDNFCAQLKNLDGMPLMEFPWSGSDEMDEASGRGWARVEKEVNWNVAPGLLKHEGKD
jgi:hypothetical protein